MILEQIEKLYREANRLYGVDSVFRSEVEAAVLRLQRKEPKIMLLFFVLRAIGVEDMLKNYELLNVKMGLGDIVGESFYAGVPSPTEAEIAFAAGISHEIQTENGLEAFER